MTCRYILYAQKFILCVLVCAFSFSDVTSFFAHPFAFEADAAQVTVDATVNTTATKHLQSGVSSVFISDQVGYKFYVDASGACVYSKSTNGGSSWGSAVTVDSQTDCYSIVVWYDKWTPGLTGSSIHIVTADTGSGNLWYNRLDTSSDTLLLGSSPVSSVTNSGQASTLAAGANHPAITEGADGTIYEGISAATDSYVVKCSASCSTAGGWTEAGTDPMNLTASWLLLEPLSDGSIMLIYRDVSANDIEYKTWNGSAWSSSWITIDANAIENATYDVGMAAVNDPDTDTIYLAYTADAATLGTDDDIRIAKYSGGSWSNEPDYTTNSSLGILELSLGLDMNTKDVYLAYAARTTPATATTGEVYWATSTAAVSSWSAVQGPVNSSADDIYGVDVNYQSDERMYVTWYQATPDDMYGSVMRDISPVTKVTSLGTQRAYVKGGSTNVYAGGAFAITENQSSRNVTNITLTESGSINASSDMKNVKLYYDLDTTAPYDCASESYSGSETQYGSTQTSGFSGANGVASFAGAVNITTTQAMCIYVVYDVPATASDATSIKLSIAAPVSDITLTGGVTAVPVTSVGFANTTTVQNSQLELTDYHWRNDDGSESAATSRTGGVQDVPLGAVGKGVPLRLRVGISNEGSTSTAPTALQLEYAKTTGTCSSASSWTDVGAANDDWNMFNSSFITDGTDSTNIATSSGGVSDRNATFLTPNGGLRDTSSHLGSLTFTPNNWTEAEFSIIASTSASDGYSYCFRLTDNGTALSVYAQYPRVTISSDVTVSATGTQTTNGYIPSTNFYTGGAFVVTDNVGSHSVTGVTLTENGTVNATSGISSVKLYYDLDTTAPYDCASESYSGSETQYGSSATFSGAGNTAVFSGSVSISTTQTLCLYPVVSISSAARTGETLDLAIEVPGSDVSVSGGATVGPTTPVDITASTTLLGALVTQSHYHWRNNDGGETGATSATGGSEDTPVTEFGKQTPIRLRLELSNNGATTSIPHRYGLEYGIKSTSCSAVSVWSDPNSGGISWDMFDSSFLTNASDTTNIAVANGGVSDPLGKSFMTPNAGVRDTDSFTATTTLTSSQFTELEYSIESTADTPYETTFCFRVTQDGNPLLQYDAYPEITTQAKRDFKVQRGTTIVTGSGKTLTAGVDYTAPSSSSTAFVRITNSDYTGAGTDVGGGNQTTRNYAAYISNPGNIKTNFTISRYAASTATTSVSWEILEYVGPSGGDNEMKVLSQGTVNPATADLIATGTAVSGVTNNSNIVVFITGQSHNANTRTAPYAHQFTSAWSQTAQAPVFTRGASGAAANVSYAVVEFSGLNWKIQRVEHSYTAAGAVETENIAPVNSLSHAFVYAQKRYGAGSNMSDFGHQVWLPSIGYVSFEIDSTASTTYNPVSVAWIIENMQTSYGAMAVQQSNGNTTGGTEPYTLTVPLSSNLKATNNSSIFVTASLNQTGTNMPRPIAGAYINSTSSYQLWRSDTGGVLSYRTEIVEWPAADLAIRQDYYRFYVDSDTLTPSDPWPVGTTSDLGENTSIASLDSPLSSGDHLRVRMSVRVDNATMPAGYLQMKLQYGLRVTSCSAISSWSDVGAAGSGEIWRAYDAPGVSSNTTLSTNPPTGGDLLLSVSDIAGRYTEDNPTDANSYHTSEGQDIEYDWNIEQNGALQRSTYCFRMIKSDDTALDGYYNYPQIRTDGYTPVSQSWRWYDDENDETPVQPMESENVSPTDVEKNDIVKLRVTVNDIKNLSQLNARFKLQFATLSDFSDATDVAATSTCTVSSVWCYADGAGNDNALITTSVLTDNDGCSGGAGNGCGVHNESPDAANGFDHLALRKIEDEFTIKYMNVDRNFGRVYYFRLYDIVNGEAVTVNTGYTSPSLSVEATHLNVQVLGLPSGTSTASALTTASTSASAIPFNDLSFGTPSLAAQRITVSGNAPDGYEVFVEQDHDMENAYGITIPGIASTNATPSAWSIGCTASSSGCFGYHTDDDVLKDDPNRFSSDDSFAALSLSPGEVIYNSASTTETHTILYKLEVGQTQASGNYGNSITYLVVPIY